MLSHLKRRLGRGGLALKLDEVVFARQQLDIRLFDFGLDLIVFSEAGTKLRLRRAQIERWKFSWTNRYCECFRYIRVEEN